MSTPGFIWIYRFWLTRGFASSSDTWLLRWLQNPLLNSLGPRAFFIRRLGRSFTYHLAGWTKYIWNVAPDLWKRMQRTVVTCSQYRWASTTLLELLFPKRILFDNWTPMCRPYETDNFLINQSTGREPWIAVIGPQSLKLKSLEVGWFNFQWHDARIFQAFKGG